MFEPFLMLMFEPEMEEDVFSPNKRFVSKTRERLISLPPHFENGQEVIQIQT
jgi:hypothetical protein